MAYLKWSCLALCVSASLLACYFIEQHAALEIIPQQSSSQTQIKIYNMDIQQHGKFRYRLQAEQATETMMHSGFLRISVVRYLELEQARFDCYIVGLGQVQFQAARTQTDILMQTIRMQMVQANFANGVVAKINTMTIKITNGQIVAKKVLLLMPNGKQQRLLELTWNMFEYMGLGTGLVARNRF